MKAIRLVLLVSSLLIISNVSNARDDGQWDASSPEIREWYRELKQPDNSAISCCGEADSYYADKVYTKDGKNIAVITDTRPDGPLQRPHVPVGTEIVIPDHKMKWDKGNPTGHSIIFLSSVNEEGRHDVYCFVDGNDI